MHLYGHTLCAISCLNITVHLSALHAVLYIQQVCRRSKEFPESMVEPFAETQGSLVCYAEGGFFQMCLEICIVT